MLSANTYQGWFCRSGRTAPADWRENVQLIKLEDLSAAEGLTCSVISDSGRESQDGPEDSQYAVFGVLQKLYIMTDS